jgi:hypothetical protein
VKGKCTIFITYPPQFQSDVYSRLANLIMGSSPVSSISWSNCPKLSLHTLTRHGDTRMMELVVEVTFEVDWEKDLDVDHSEELMKRCSFNEVCMGKPQE